MRSSCWKKAQWPNIQKQTSDANGQWQYNLIIIHFYASATDPSGRAYELLNKVLNFNKTNGHSERGQLAQALKFINKCENIHKI